MVPDREGRIDDVVLGYDTEEAWHQGEPSMNAIMGRVANRIRGGEFVLDGVRYVLPCNDGPNCLHGGLRGFHQREWTVVRQTAAEVRLQYLSPDGEEGFPGNVRVEVSYRLSGRSLFVSCRATTDAATLVNLTHHAYFNLCGGTIPVVEDHYLQLFADTYTAQDSTACPTGEILPVKGTPMDFREAVRLGDRLHDAWFAPTRGLNHNFIIRPGSLAARLSGGGRTMEVYTNQPGLQVYTAGWLAAGIGRGGQRIGPNSAICLEPQCWPDAIHHSHFPSPVLRPGETYSWQTEYRFL